MQFNVLLIMVMAIAGIDLGVVLATETVTSLSENTLLLTTFLSQPMLLGLMHTAVLTRTTDVRRSRKRTSLLAFLGYALFKMSLLGLEGAFFTDAQIAFFLFVVSGAVMVFMARPSAMNDQNK